MKLTDIIFFYTNLVFTGIAILTTVLAGLFIYSLFWLLIVPPMFLSDVFTTLIRNRR
jgi:hypothetical protein